MADEKPENGAEQPEAGEAAAPETPETPATDAAAPETPETPAADAAAPETPETPAREPAAPEAAETPAPEPAAPEAAEPPAAEAAAPAAAEGADDEPEAEEPEPEPEPDPLVTALQEQFPGAVEQEGEDMAGAPIVRVGADNLIDVLTWLRDSEATKFNYLADLTVTDWTERAPRFDVIYHLYSIGVNHFITVKTGCDDGEGVPTTCDVWGTANWHEREAYDLYGIEFLGHPELERIFLPEDWEGFPLRKDYPLEGPNLELLTRQQAAFRGGRFDRIRGDYEMTEQERQLSSAGIVGALWTPKPEAPEPAADEEPGEPAES